MKEENKQLLFTDLCVRLPYHVRCKIWLEDGTTEEGPLDLEHNYGDVLQDAFFYHKIKDIKPYLRPMSSMTKEEKKIYNDLLLNTQVSEIYFPDCEDMIPVFDWLNKNMFDYRGLIPKGHAIKVTKDNNPYNDL
jgi:hypothetical protein